MHFQHVPLQYWFEFLCETLYKRFIEAMIIDACFWHFSLYPPLPLSYNLPMFLPPSCHPSLLPPCSPVDHPDADREQCATGGPAGWGGSWPWGRWRRSLARGWDARRNGWWGFGQLWARSWPPGALCAIIGRPSLSPSPEGTPGLLNVRTRGSTWTHGPWPPSPGLPGSPPAAPQHTQRKLEPLPWCCLTSSFPIGGPDWQLLAQLMGGSPVLTSLFSPFSCIPLTDPSLWKVELCTVPIKISNSDLSKTDLAQCGAFLASLRMKCTSVTLRRKMENECFTCLVFFFLVFFFSFNCLAVPLVLCCLACTPFQPFSGSSPASA